MGRPLNIRKTETVEVGRGDIYRALNQNNVIDRFFNDNFYPSKPSRVTVFYVEAGDDPTKLAGIGYKAFLELVAEETAVIFENPQKCTQSKDTLDISQILVMEKDGTISAFAFTHLMAHILLRFALRCLDPFVDLKVNFSYQEVVFQNVNNAKENIVVYNFPTRVGVVGNMAETILVFFELWIRGIRKATIKNGKERQVSLLERLKELAEMSDDDRIAALEDA